MDMATGGYITQDEFAECMTMAIADYISSPLFMERMKRVSDRSSYTYASLLPDDLHLIAHKDYYKSPIDILCIDGQHISL